MGTTILRLPVHWKSRGLSESDRGHEEAIKRAQEYHNKFVLSGDYYYKGMKDAEMFAHDLKEEDLI